MRVTGGPPGVLEEVDTRVRGTGTVVTPDQIGCDRSKYTEGFPVDENLWSPTLKDREKKKNK